MLVDGRVRCMLLRGIIVGLIAFATAASAKPLDAPSTSASVAGSRLYGERGSSRDARLREVHQSHFCRWHPRHGLCVVLVSLRRFCDRRPDHRFCDDDDNRFCRRRPKHPLCDDDRFCRKRPHHPLCDDDPPPSPS
jgi:hypothetical protein